MADSIYTKRKSLFFALESTEGNYTAPATSAFILAELDKPDHVSVNRDKVEMYSTATGLFTAEKMASKYSRFPFKVPLSWPAVAPAAAAGFMAISPLLEACGAQPPTYQATPTPAKILYSENGNTESIKSGSLSFRRGRTSTTQLERRSAGVRGSVGFEWEIGKIPRFTFDMIGSHLDMAAAANLASTPGTQLTNLSEAGNTSQIGAITLGGNSLCLVKMTNKNLFRHEASWTQFGCGDRAQSKLVTENDIVVGFKWPKIDTEFNPDSLLNTEQALTLQLVQAGGSRKLNMSYTAVQILDYDEFDIGEELGCEMTLRQISPISMSTE